MARAVNRHQHKQVIIINTKKYFPLVIAFVIVVGVLSVIGNIYKFTKNFFSTKRRQQ